ncbi:MAG: hypothetical protein EPO42_06875 [Gallionellaceae bacterium]|nr:MAG: hypothetical protein EPO42_06875 [Gallionellaceae bacterium]
MKEFSKFVGLDVRKKTIAVSVAEANGGELRHLGEAANTPEAPDSEEAGIPYQNLINLYLRDCAASHRKLNLNWK